MNSTYRWFTFTFNKRREECQVEALRKLAKAENNNLHATYSGSRLGK